MITLQFDLRAFKDKARQMGVFADDQLPYAISRTLNDTMRLDVQPQVSGPTWASAFKVRNKGLPKASLGLSRSRILSNKHQRPWTAGVQDALGKANLGVHATGGARPKPGPRLAIPNQRGRVQLHARGRKPWARQVPKMVPKRALRVTRGGIFVGEGGRLHAVYWFRPAAKLSKRFQFYRDFQKKTERGLAERFPRHLQAAVASSFR